MSDFYTIKQIVLSAVSRHSGAFNTGSNNFVDTAVNNAIIYAQRKADFEWCKEDVSIECNPIGNILQTRDELGDLVKIKKVIKAFGLHKPEVGERARSVPYLSRVSQIADDTSAAAHGCQNACPRVIHQGQKVYHTPIPQDLPYTLYFYAVKWLPRLVKNEDTNFLLEYGFDFIMYRSILELNFFIKEDERFPVSQTMLSDAWQSLVSWDASLVSPTETEIEL